MKHSLAIIALMSFFYPCFSQSNDIESKEVPERREYLMKVSKEVIMTFGPDYYRDFQDPIISDTISFLESFMDYPALKDKKMMGKKYYTVTYRYDSSKETLLYDYAAEVDIWADDGQPKEVRFGSGYGYNFYVVSYKEWIKKGIKDSEIIPYISTNTEQ